MRAMIVLALFFAVAACAEQKGPLTQAYEGYKACLDTKPAADCENERVKFEAAKAYVDSASRATGAPPPLVLADPRVGAPRQGVTCIQNGIVTNC